MKAILVLGSNSGCREKNITAAVKLLETCCIINKSSDIYESPDKNGMNKNYLNMVLEAETCLSENDLNKLLKSFEVKCGRTETCRKRGDVPIDMDIVLWEDEIKRPADYKAQYFKIGYEALL